MTLQCRLAAAFFLLIASVFVSADKAKDQSEDWLPITQQDLAIKDVPGDPGADAIQLYHSYYKDDDAKFISEYRRIKILNEAARKRADIEIPIAQGESLKEVAARTIHPDGSIFNYSGKPFDKLVYKKRDLKYLYKTFTLPDVTVGSIIEYRYVISLPRGFVSTISSWPMQEDMFTVKARLRFRAFQGVVLTATEWTSAAPKSAVSYSYLNQLDVTLPQKKEGNLMELELQNVPKFDAEDYMPPVDDFRPVILFYYGGHEMSSPERFWDEWQKLITEYVEKFIGNSHEVHEAAAQAIAGETDPEQKLRKLYARAQQIRNLSYERFRTERERQEEHLKHNNTAQEILQHGYGTAWDVNALFTALARAVGFDATMLGVSDRTVRSFNKIIVWLGQIDSSAVLVSMQGKEQVLSPGTPFCPFGLLRWGNTATTALKFSKAGGGFIDTPQPQSAVMRRIARATVGADGDLTGELSVDFNGEDALDHRLNGLSQDEAGKRSSLENEVKGWLPKDAIVKLTDSRNWESPDQPLVATFKFEIPTFASSAGKRLVLPAFFLPTMQRDLFSSASRRYPIAFPYPFAEDDEISIQLPDGYEVEESPYRRKAGLYYAGYEISSTIEDRRLVTRRKIRLDGVQFPPEKYEELKNFFSIVYRGDTGQAVLHQPAAAKVQSQN
jgi:hypothetical protein